MIDIGLSQYSIIQTGAKLGQSRLKLGLGLTFIGVMGTAGGIDFVHRILQDYGL